MIPDWECMPTAVTTMRPLPSMTCLRLKSSKLPLLVVVVHSRDEHDDGNADDDGDALNAAVLVLAAVHAVLVVLLALVIKLILRFGPVKRESKADQCRDLQHDQGFILQRFPDEVEKRFRLFERDFIVPVDSPTKGKVLLVALQACEHRTFKGIYAQFEAESFDAAKFVIQCLYRVLLLF
ncbi:hypothetical protein TYRP_014215 [Tyrophagus putrescentiae]|nr:hypothetical protein TYRP_014215 [Tyrophagus putrescentiae]